MRKCTFAYKFDPRLDVIGLISLILSIANSQEKHVVTTANLMYTKSYHDKLDWTLWHPTGFGDFRQKKHLNAHGFADEYLRSCSL